jgi:hypothetical protein
VVVALVHEVERMSEKQVFVISLIALLVSVGVPISERAFGDVFSNELKDYYRCDSSGVIKEFKGGVSGTLYSGYPFVGSRAGVVYCGSSENKGKWVKLSDYAQSVGVDPYELLLASEPVVPVRAARERCDFEGCVSI